MKNTYNEKGLKIDMRKLIALLLQGKRQFMITLAITLVLSAVYIFSIPRFYTCKVMLAPESIEAASGLGSIMSSFGLGDMANGSTDAIYPMLYPDLIESKEFMCSLFDAKIETDDGDVHSTYYDYLLKHQKQPWWNGGVKAIKSLFPKNENTLSQGRVNNKKQRQSFALTVDEETVTKILENNISCKIDNKTNVITISVIDQDPLVSAIIADTMMIRLQRFITEYRTKKARGDVEYTTKIYKEAKELYDKAAARYAAYSDANWDIVSNDAMVKRQTLENDMNIKYNNFSSISTQLQAARAKVQENTPAFTLLQGPTIPSKPTGPKRVMFVFAMMIVAFMCNVLFVLRKHLLDIFA